MSVLDVLKRLRGREAHRKTLTKGGLFCEDDVG